VPHRHSRRHRTRVGGRAIELLRSRPLVWVAALLVNAVTGVATRNYGLATAVPLTLGTALATSVAVWLFGYVSIRRGRLMVVRQRLSLRRMGALVLAVFLASLLAGLTVRSGLFLMEQMEQRPPEVDS
jgi:hypothetical protein